MDSPDVGHIFTSVRTSFVQMYHIQIWGGTSSYICKTFPTAGIRNFLPQEKYH